MPCYHPLRLASATRSKLIVACGQCVGCRLERSRQWAVRCMHEAAMHDENCSLTLTYDDDHLKSGSLVYRDFQLFMKSFRKVIAPRRVRFFMCGEYGEKYLRPHFHALIFGESFFPWKYSEKSPAGFNLYTNELLSWLWPLGRARIGELTFESAAYAARYVMKKVTGPLAPLHYSDPDTGEMIKPEFCVMSRRPGIGSDWLRLYWPEVVREGKCLSRGVEASAPKFYRRKLRDLSEYDSVRRSEFLAGLSRLADQTDERLAVSERVAIARISRLKRSI